VEQVAPGRPAGGGRHVAERAGRNTAVRAAAEIAGKLASLLLVVVLAREVGPQGVGVYVLALAWAELAVTPVEMGFDRYLLRRVARDHRAADELLFNVLAAKLLRAVPVAVATVALAAVALGGEERRAVYVACVAVLLTSLGYTLLSFFNAHERGGLGAVTILVQRVLAAALGLVALAAGFEVVAVLVAMAAAAAAAFALALVLAARRIGLPRRAVSRAGRRALRRHSWPFAGQELLSVGITRIDALLLTALASTTVVGLYGASYRLFEATLFVPLSVTAAFGALFAYLAPDSDPPVRVVFERALQLTLAALVPMGVAYVLLAEPLIRLFFGEGFGGAVDPLRLLGPTAVLLGVVLVSTSLVVSRTDARRMVPVFGLALVVNVAANVALIPPLEQSGAALAMLLTEAVFAAVVVRMAATALGGLSAVHCCAAPLLAGAAMAVPTAALASAWPAALAAGLVAYVAVYAAVAGRVAPGDVAFVVETVRRLAGR
jgi:O-antigen/teichoic acid export membrane protein